MPERTLTIRGVSDAVLERLRARATAGRRSLNGEILTILERAAAAADVDGGDSSPTGYSSSVQAAAVREPGGHAYDAFPRQDLFGLLDMAMLADVCRRHHITRLAVFGSHARGDARADSDVDVLVEFAPGMTPGFGIVRVADALRPALGNRRVDLVTRRGLPSPMRERVLGEARELYAAG
jgi:uncharacterized protein